MNGGSNVIVDSIYELWMQRQYEEGMALARESDILKLHIPAMSPPHFVAEYFCKGLVRGQDGVVREAEHFEVGIWFPPDYLRRANASETLRIFTPNAWHPNVHPDLPLICIGQMVPGTTLVDILYQVYHLLTYQEFNLGDAMNPIACAWARERQREFPVDSRPLKRRRLNLEVIPA